MPSILIAEDHARTAELLGLKFRQAGWEVFECRTGGEALDVLLSRPVQLVLTDSSLRARDGSPLLPNIRSTLVGESVPILLFSGMMPDAAQELVGLGVVDAFVPKPAPVDRVIAEARRLLGMDTRVVTREVTHVVVVSSRFERWVAELAHAGWTVEGLRQASVAVDVIEHLRFKTLVVDLEVDAPLLNILVERARRSSGEAQLPVLGIRYDGFDAPAPSGFDAIVDSTSPDGSLTEAVGRHINRVRV